MGIIHACSLLKPEDAAFLGKLQQQPEVTYVDCSLEKNGEPAVHLTMWGAGGSLSLTSIDCPGGSTKAGYPGPNFSKKDAQGNTMSGHKTSGLGSGAHSTLTSAKISGVVVKTSETEWCQGSTTMQINVTNGDSFETSEKIARAVSARIS